MLRERRKPVFLFLMVFALTMGCNGEAATQPITAVSSITFTAVHSADTPIPLSEPSIPSTTTDTPITPIPTAELPFAIVRIFPSRRDLATRLAVEVQKAYALGYTPVVEFDAPW
jgi:hypothetical protein